jgi:hypothetical protein
MRQGSTVDNLIRDPCLGRFQGSGVSSTSRKSLLSILLSFLLPFHEHGTRGTDQLQHNLQFMSQI